MLAALANGTVFQPFGFAVRNPKLCRDMGAAARERICRQFDEREMVARTLDVYRQLLAARKVTCVSHLEEAVR